MEKGEGAHARRGSSARAPSRDRLGCTAGWRRHFLASSASAGWPTQAEERKKKPAKKAPPSGEKQGVYCSHDSEAVGR